MVNAVSNVVNFKQSNMISMKKNNNIPVYDSSMTPEDILIIQQQEDRKAQKSRDRWNKAGVIASCTLAAGIVLGPLLGLGITAGILKGAGKEMKTAFSKGLGEQEGASALKFFDVSKEKTFEQLTLSKEMKKAVDDMKTSLERTEWLQKKGAKGGTGIMLYGEPGGGKNAYVYALTKYLEEKFPGSKMVEMNIAKLQSKFHGGSENNIVNFCDNAIKEAQADRNKKLVVFMDEFDSITRKDDGLNAKSTEAIQNAFKTSLVKLTSEPNIILVAATNKAEKGAPLSKLLDDAILNRFPKKIHVPLPTEEQLRAAFADHYKSLPKEFVDQRLTDKNNSELKSLCKYIAKKDHHASFRDFSYITDAARIISESKGRNPGSKITMKDFRQAVKEHGESENWGKIKKVNTENVSNKCKNIWKKIKDFFKGND